MNNWTWISDLGWVFYVSPIVFGVGYVLYKWARGDL